VRAPRIRPQFGTATSVLTTGGPRIDVLALPLQPGADGPEAGPGTAQALAALGIDLAQVLRLEQPSASAGSLTRVPWTPVPDESGQVPAVDRVLLTGVGDGSPAALRSVGAALARSQRGRDRLVTTVGGRGGEPARALAEGLVLGSYAPPRSGIGSAPPPPVRRVDVVGRVVAADLAHGVAVAEATVLARDLANTPSSTKGPSWLAGRARRAAAESGLRCRVRDHRELAAEGFGGILAVGAGASRPPRLVELEYVPDEETRSRRVRPPHVVLVGKGITFDTGGISLKPREAMVPMKTDMSGAGAVLATVRACRALGVKVRVTALLPLAENAIGATSYRPGDVITHYGGRTVEVRNTDAEGRLVLADALAYADAVLDPDLVVDIATLTGAATQTLGRGMGALFSGDERLATALLDAGERSGERLWRMPLVEDYRQALDSDHADLCHIATVPGVGAGAVLAALFLREFAGGRRWAHLDVAGPARSERDAGLVSKGGTGFGARLLLRWLQTLG
jgi:leucyl aminopeptidase